MSPGCAGPCGPCRLRPEGLTVFCLALCRKAALHSNSYWNWSQTHLWLHLMAFHMKHSAAEKDRKWGTECHGSGCGFRILGLVFILWFIDIYVLFSILESIVAVIIKSSVRLSLVPSVFASCSVSSPMLSSCTCLHFPISHFLFYFDGYWSLLSSFCLHQLCPLCPSICCCAWCLIHFMGCEILESAFGCNKGSCLSALSLHVHPREGRHRKFSHCLKSPTLHRLRWNACL